MFRYCLLLTGPRVARETRLALDARLVRDGWRRVLSTAVLQAYVRGDDGRAAGARALPSNDGVVLGTLFVRPPAVAGASAITLSRAAARAALDSDARSLLETHWGRYVVALADPRRARVVVCRDPSGALPCYRCRVGKVEVICSWLADALLLGAGPFDIDWDYVAAYAALGLVRGPRTALVGVSTLQPGYAWEFDLRTTPLAVTDEVRWRADAFARAAQAHAPLAEDEARAALREVVRVCVAAWGRRYDAVVLHLSGGLDSSIVLASLVHAGRGPSVLAVNAYSSGSDTDERRYARAVAAHARCRLLERARDPTMTLARVLDVAPTAEPVALRLLAETSAADAALARAIGAGAIFTGVGGDQVFGRMRAALALADARADGHPWRRLLGAAYAAARADRQSVAGVLREATAARAATADPAAQTQRFRSLVVDAVARRAFGDPAFRPAFGPALGDPRRLGPGKRWQLFGLAYPPVAYDPLLGPDAPDRVAPLLSQPVVELCAALPTYVLGTGGRDRALARAAFADDLPDVVRRRTDKGGMEEHAADVLRRNARWARELLVDGELVRAGIVARARLITVFDGVAPAGDGLLGELFDLVSLEAWIRAWRRAPRAPPSLGA